MESDNQLKQIKIVDNFNDIKFTAVDTPIKWTIKWYQLPKAYWTCLRALYPEKNIFTILKLTVLRTIQRWKNPKAFEKGPVLNLDPTTFTLRTFSAKGGRIDNESNYNIPSQ